MSSWGRGAGKVDIEPPFGQNAGPQARERAVREQASLADDDDALGQRLDIVHVVRRQHHGYALLAVEPAHEVAHGELRGRIESDGRLVEEQDCRLVQQGGGNLARMRWPSESWRTGWASSDSSRISHDSSRPAAIVRRRHAVDVGQEIEAIEHGQVPPELAALAEHHADARDVPHAVSYGTRPPTSNRPRVGRRMPDRIFTVVDLPAPLGPMKASSSPRSSEKLMPFSASITRRRGARVP